MLRAIELENFKAFGPRQRVDFAPITLLFGENSAGKTSILQSLNLLKQTRSSREHGALLLPRAENGICDLGSYRELLFNHDFARELKIRLEMDASFRSRPRKGNSAQCVHLELAFRRRSGADEVELSYFEIGVSGYGKRIARFEPYALEIDEMRGLVRDTYMLLNTARPVKVPDIRATRCTWVTEDASYWQPFYSRACELTPRILEALRQYASQKVEVENDDEAAEWLEGVEKSIDFYSKPFSLEMYIARMRVAELSSIVPMDGFLQLPLGRRSILPLPEFTALLRTGPRLLPGELTIDCRSLAFEIGRDLDSILESLYPMGPFRRPPERWYIFTGTSPQDVGYRGDLLPDLLFRRPELVDETNMWLEKLEVGYRLRVRPIGDQARDLFEVRLQDQRNKDSVDVALSDVGFGISQLLPFLVQCLASESQTITIEQPEVHVHPRLQADIGDVLISAIQEPRKHCIVVETHSEHLILRLLRRIRETTHNILPPWHPGLRPSQLSVIYVERSENGSRVHPLRIDENGEFVDKWPNGFFAERVKELF